MEATTRLKCLDIVAQATTVPAVLASTVIHLSSLQCWLEPLRWSRSYTTDIHQYKMNSLFVLFLVVFYFVVFHFIVCLVVSPVKKFNQFC